MLLDLIKTRKSVRSYTDQAIPKNDLLKCIEAARLAPSACNSQPWKYIIVDNPQLKNTVCEEAFSGVYSLNKFAKDAPVLVAVVSERSKFTSAIGGYFRGTKYYLIDIGIACEHLILQASELGIGSCWIGWFNERKVKKILKVPGLKKIDALITLGYCKDKELPSKTRNPLEQISSFNCYKS